eukprot:TRINITY_DN5628_c1_g2_i5.p2 TRINITY_DN5628_c1_g2~~TRINITY_DN5628_c1_g2_i5.p2  ORF type:complete len:224 (+),score=-12.51 TRINITY_DN5628_c1_g2_i5:110-781(+)
MPPTLYFVQMYLIKNRYYNKMKLNQVKKAKQKLQLKNKKTAQYNIINLFGAKLKKNKTNYNKNEPIVLSYMLGSIVCFGTVNISVIIQKNYTLEINYSGNNNTSNNKHTSQNFKNLFSFLVNLLVSTIVNMQQQLAIVSYTNNSKIVYIRYVLNRNQTQIFPTKLIISTISNIKQTCQANSQIPLKVPIFFFKLQHLFQYLFQINQVYKTGQKCPWTRRMCLQ